MIEWVTKQACGNSFTDVNIYWTSSHRQKSMKCLSYFVIAEWLPVK